MDQEALRAALRSGIVTIDFTKHNGSKRVMRATLQEKYLPDTQSSKDTSIIRSGEVLTVWDVENNGWRSARVDSIGGWVPEVEEAPKANTATTLTIG